ncbi:hypothetical protein EON80_22920, partial [bacterium]
KVSVYAGSGAEARRDGTFSTAAFAQTSGLALQDGKLFAADSESSTLRAIDPKAGTVKTIAGGDLFAFGDNDGQGDAVRLQHPLGITSAGDSLYLTDTYNSKIKRLDPKTGTVSTVYSGGLNEPGGLSYDDGNIFIADTNNGAIKRYDIATKKAEAITFTGLQAPAAIAPVAAPEAPVVLAAGTQVLAPGAKGKVVLDVKLPKGFHLNRAAPLKLTAKASGAGVKLGQTTLTGNKFNLPLEVPIQVAQSGKGSIDLNAFVGYCDEGTGAVCKVEIVKRRIDFEVRDGGKQELRVGVELP